MTLAGIAFGMIDRPAQALQAATQRPRSWWLPAVLLILSMAVSAWIQAPLQVELANERSEQMVARLAERLSAENAAAVRESVTNMTVPTFLASTIASGAALAAFGWLLRSVVAHLTSMAAGGASTFGQTFAVTVWSMLPFFLRDALQAVYVLTQGKLIPYQGLSSLVATGDWLQESGNVLFGLLASIDPFMLWSLVLLGIGVSVSARVRRRTGILVACLAWGVVLALKLASVAISAAMQMA
ncbi:MAG: YIP1 family protein [Anaerolineae bacterium]